MKGSDAGMRGMDEGGREMKQRKGQRSAEGDGTPPLRTRRQEAAQVGQLKQSMELEGTAGNWQVRGWHMGLPRWH